MKTNTKIYNLCRNRWAVLGWLGAIIIGIIAVPAMVTYAQQPPPPPPLPIVLGPVARPPTGAYGPEERVPECSGVIAEPKAKVWQIWPLNGIIELGNGSQPAMLHIRQCSGYDNEAESRSVEFWLRLSTEDEWLPKPETKIALIDASVEQGNRYAADADYDFSLSGQPGIYTLWVGTKNWQLPLQSIEVRSGPAVNIQNPLTGGLTRSFQSNETMGVTYQGFKPNIALVVGLYQYQSQATAGYQYQLARWGTILSDRNGNYQETFPPNMPSGWYRMAVCYPDGSLCDNPIQSTEFEIVSGADASVPGGPGNPNGTLSNEIE